MNENVTVRLLCVKDATFTSLSIKNFNDLFIHKMLIEHLLYAKPQAMSWRYSDPPGAYCVVGETDIKHQ